MMAADGMFRRCTKNAVMMLCLAGFSPVVLAGVPLVAQSRGPVQRSVVGRVENKAGDGIKGAVVYLKDTRNSSVKSAITSDDGSYRFVQLSQGTDYELYAKSDGKTSKSRSISSFDTKNDFTINLKID
jgi:hypothetical protein